MPRFEPLNRRAFLADLGKAGLAIAVIGTVGCASDDETAGGSPGPTSESPATSGGWRRVDLGFVSAYVLVRAGETAIVDTGTSGSADNIESSLADAGVGWDAVGHVILTHKHPDHVGSLEEVLTRAPDAAAYAGEADIPAITSPREITAVADGESIFDLQVIATPGHTPGHISVLDASASVLVAGDAIVGEGDGVGGPNAQFSEDLSVARASATKLGALDFDTVLFGHGEPVVGGASAAVAELNDEG